MQYSGSYMLLFFSISHLYFSHSYQRRWNKRTHYTRIHILHSLSIHTYKQRTEIHLGSSSAVPPCYSRICVCFYFLSIILPLSFFYYIFLFFSDCVFITPYCRYSLAFGMKNMLNVTHFAEHRHNWNTAPFFFTNMHICFFSFFLYAVSLDIRHSCKWKNIMNIIN